MAKSPGGSKAQDFLGRCADGLCGIPASRGRPPPVGHGRFGEGTPEAQGPPEDTAPVVDRLVLGEGPLPGDMALAALAFALVAKLERPRHSGLRSVCLLLHRQHRTLHAEVGVSVEVAGLAGGCSAEASAVSRLLLRQAGRSPLQAVERAVLASDARRCLGPGPQARELLAEHLELGTPVVCAWRGGASGTELRFETHELSALCPRPFAYRRLPPAELAAFAQALAARCAAVPAPARGAFEAAREAAAAAASRAPPGNEGAPVAVAYAAAALLQGGDVVVCEAEDPPPPDAAARLVRELARREARPELLLVCDCWGVLHAPAPAARSCLSLQGFGDVPVLLHDAETGALLQPPLAELLGAASGAAEPEAPAAGGAEAEGSKP